MTHMIGYNFDALAHSLYTRSSLDPQDTEAGKYYSYKTSIILFHETCFSSPEPKAQDEVL